MRLGHEQLIATRTLARPSRKIFRKIPIALALALLGHHLHHRWLGRGGRLPQPLPVPVTSALFSPLLLPLRRRAITPCRVPTSPLLGRFPTRLAAVALERMGRRKGLLTSLQQANAPIASGTLTRSVACGILRWAHGRYRSHRSSLGGELRTRLRGVLIGTAASA